MSKLELFYPVTPLHINQVFANDPAYYSKFHDANGNPLKGHNGVDFMAVHGQPIYAPIGGMAVYNKDAHGGEGLTITTDQAYEYAGGTCWFGCIHWHLIGDTDPKYPQPFTSKHVEVGDLIGYADNTGAPYESSGDHLHFGLMPITQNKKLLLPSNGFNGCIDPIPYFNGKYALEGKLNTLQKLLISTLQALLSKLQGK
jgi:murein DD-endopeptidase MepM/ murein hydrolase activator NlpD